MAFEEIWAPQLVILILTAAIFPILAILYAAFERIEFKFAWKKYVALFVIAYVIACAAFPLAVSDEFIPFNSVEISYFLVLLLTFVGYLIVYNRTK